MWVYIHIWTFWHNKSVPLSISSKWTILQTFPQGCCVFKAVKCSRTIAKGIWMYGTQDASSETTTVASSQFSSIVQRLPWEPMLHQLTPPRERPATVNIWSSYLSITLGNTVSLAGQLTLYSITVTLTRLVNTALIIIHTCRART